MEPGEKRALAHTMHQAGRGAYCRVFNRWLPNGGPTVTTPPCRSHPLTTPVPRSLGTGRTGRAALSKAGPTISRQHSQTGRPSRRTRRSPARTPEEPDPLHQQTLGRFPHDYGEFTGSGPSNTATRNISSSGMVRRDDPIRRLGARRSPARHRGRILRSERTSPLPCPRTECPLICAQVGFSS